MKHRNKNNVYIAIAGICLALGMTVIVFFDAVPAQATPGMMPFGGVVLYSVPLPINNPPPPRPPCPAHTVVSDIVTHQNIGIMTTGVSAIGPMFLYNNFITPGVWTLGEHVLLPQPTCIGTPGVNYFVYLGFYNGTSGRFQIGTGLTPGF
jgi:hypothetical protein